MSDVSEENAYINTQSDRTSVSGFLSIICFGNKTGVESFTVAAQILISQDLKDHPPCAMTEKTIPSVV